MKSRTLLLVIMGLFLSGAIAYAHHSFAATYFEDQKVTVHGKLVQFLYRNPHSFVHIMAPDEKGVMQRWAVEWSGTTQLGAQGVSRESLKVGDEVVIFARPSRVPGEYRALMLRLKRTSDGFAWGSPGQSVD